MKIAELRRNKYGQGDLGIGSSLPPTALPREPWQVQGYDVYIRLNQGYWYVDLCDGEEIISKIILWHGIDPKLYQPVPGIEVMSSTVKRGYQGRGIGIDAYKSLVLKKHITLYSAGSHSLGARKLWVRLSQDRDIMVYATRKRGRQVALPIANGNELAVPGWRLYGSEGTALMAVAAGSPVHHQISQLVRDTATAT
jgi:hypothetical protein